MCMVYLESSLRRRHFGLALLRTGKSTEENPLQLAVLQFSLVGDIIPWVPAEIEMFM
jgi:hypothetical protein